MSKETGAGAGIGTGLRAGAGISRHRGGEGSLLSSLLISPQNWQYSRERNTGANVGGCHSRENGHSGRCNRCRGLGNGDRRSCRSSRRDCRPSYSRRNCHGNNVDNSLGAVGAPDGRIYSSSTCGCDLSTAATTASMSILQPGRWEAMEGSQLTCHHSSHDAPAPQRWPRQQRTEKGGC